MNVLIMFILLAALAAMAGPVEDLQPGQWYEVPNSHMAGVGMECGSECPECPDHWPSGVTCALNATGVAGVMSAWSGGAYDTKRDRLVIWGGGHHAYAGNEIYVFDLNTLRWSRLTDPYYQTDTGTEGIAEYATTDGTVQPRARHTYEFIEYVPSMDRFCSFGSSGPYPSGGISSDRVHCFNFETLRWERRPPTPAYGVDALSAYDPVTGHEWVQGTDSHDNFAEFAPEEGSYGVWHTRINDDPTSDFNYKYQLTAALDPKFRKFIAVGGGHVFSRDITNPENVVRATLTTSGPQDIVGANDPGFDYDPVSEKLIGWNTGRDVFTLDLAANTWTRHTGAGANPGSPEPTGTYGRFRYSPLKNVFVLVNSISTNVFIYRHTAPAAAPTWYLDLLQNNSVEAKKAPATGPAMTVFPNPVSSTAEIRVSGHSPLSIYDAKGRLVRTFNGNSTGKFIWHAGHLANGIYLAKIRDGQRRITKRIFLVK